MVFMEMGFLSEDLIEYVRILDDCFGCGCGCVWVVGVSVSSCLKLKP